MTVLLRRSNESYIVPSVSFSPPTALCPQPPSSRSGLPRLSTIMPPRKKGSQSRKPSRARPPVVKARTHRTPTPQPPDTSVTPSRDWLLVASTPTGPVYSRLQEDVSPPGSVRGQHSDDEDEEEKEDREAAEAVGLEEVQEEEIVPEAVVVPKHTRTHRTKDEEAKRIAAADHLSLVVSEQAMAKLKELQMLAKEATLGYTAFPLASAPRTMTWGKHNTRDINKTKSNELLQNMEKGLNNCDPETVIRIGMRREWYNGNFTDDLMGKTVLDLPGWRLTAAGLQAMKEGRIIPFSGNHRRDAITDLLKLSKKRVRALENEMKRMAPKGPEELDTVAFASYKKKDESLVTLKEHAEKSKLWCAQVYDLGI